MTISLNVSACTVRCEQVSTSSMITVARSDVEVARSVSFKPFALMGIETTSQYVQKTKTVGKKKWLRPFPVFSSRLSDYHVKKKKRKIDLVIIIGFNVD